MSEQKRDWFKIIIIFFILIILANVGLLDYLVGRGKESSEAATQLEALEEKIALLVTRQQALELAVTDIATYSALPVTLPTPSPTVVEREKVVERIVTQAPSAAVKEYHIPLGYATKATEHYDWVDTGVEATFDITNYGAVQEAKFEATLSVPEGQVEVRLYNVSDRNVIGGSTLVGDSQSPQLHRSSNLNFPAGQKTYRVQMRTSVNTVATMHSGGIRILLK